MGGEAQAHRQKLKPGHSVPMRHGVHVHVGSPRYLTASHCTFLRAEHHTRNPEILTPSLHPFFWDLIKAPVATLSVQTLEFDVSDNHGDHKIVSHVDAPDRASVLHTLPLNLTPLQLGGVWVTDDIGSERARQLLKTTQLSHNRL